MSERFQLYKGSVLPSSTYPTPYPTMHIRERGDNFGTPVWSGSRDRPLPGFTNYWTSGNHLSFTDAVQLAATYQRETPNFVAEDFPGVAFTIHKRATNERAKGSCRAEEFANRWEKLLLENKNFEERNAIIYGKGGFVQIEQIVSPWEHEPIQFQITSADPLGDSYTKFVHATLDRRVRDQLPAEGLGTLLKSFFDGTYQPHYSLKPVRA